MRDYGQGDRMSDIRFVEVSIDMQFEQCDGKNSSFEKEFLTFTHSEDDAVGQWLRTMRSRGELGDSDPVMINLMIELYRKMDRIEKALTGEFSSSLPLSGMAIIEKMGLEHFELDTSVLEIGTTYYGRIELPIFPKRDTCVFFEAIAANRAKITRMHLRDSDHWAVYMTARERAIIRSLKGLG
jgi:hypothetical protein